MLKNKKNRKYFTVLLLIFSVAFFFNLTANAQKKFLESNGSFEHKKDFQGLLQSPSRSTVDLNGYWDYSLDNSNWKRVSIPSAYDFEDKVTFQRNFNFPTLTSGSKNLLLVCYGINYQCEVYINNEFVGHHVGGYTSFVFRIPDRIINPDGNNTIKIIVDNDLNSRESVPLQQQIGGWRNYGGIFREIYLVSLPALFFDDINITSELNSNYSAASVKVSYQITSTELKKLKYDSIEVSPGTKNSFEIYFQVYDKTSNNLVAQSVVSPFEVEDNRSIRFNAECTLNSPSLWQPNSPNLYVLKSVILKNGKVVDQVSQNFGVRDLKIIGQDFYLNGKLFELKGINYVEDYPESGSALSYDDVERDILSLKSLGVNIINSRYYPASPYLISLCDKYGIFICETIPVWNTPGDFLNQVKYRTIVENYVKEMVMRDRNHPSIFAWGIGSNFDSSDPLARTYCDQMHNLIKSLDKKFTYYSTSLITNDTCYGTTDFNLVNIDVTDLKKFSALLNIWKKKNKETPIVVNIAGAAIVPENHNGFGDPQSVEYQAHYIFDRFRVLQQNDVSNMFLSNFADYRSGKPILNVNNYDRYLFSAGVVSYYRESRVAYNMLKALYNDEKTPNLIVGDYNQNHPLIYILWGLLLLVIFAYIFNAYRRFRENIVRSFLRPFNFYADIRDQRIMSNVQTTVIGFIISGTIALVVSNLCYFFRFSYLFDYILTHLIPSNDIKYWLSNQIWNPTRFILSFTLLNLLIIIIATLLIKMGSIIAKKRIFVTDAFAIVIWSALPSIILIPVGMILSRIIESDTYLIPVIALLVIEFIWIFYRLIKGVSIVYDVKVSKIYFYAIVVVVIIFGSFFIYINHENSTLSYFKFFINIVKGSQI
jgi:beta-galactosidase